MNSGRGGMYKGGEGGGGSNSGCGGMMRMRTQRCLFERNRRSKLGVHNSVIVVQNSGQNAGCRGVQAGACEVWEQFTCGMWQGRVCLCSDAGWSGEMMMKTTMSNTKKKKKKEPRKCEE